MLSEQEEECAEEWVEDRQKDEKKRKRGRGGGVFYAHGALEDLERTMGEHPMFQCVPQRKRKAGRRTLRSLVRKEGICKR